MEDFKTIKCFFFSIFIDKRKWFQCIKNGKLEENWYLENDPVLLDKIIENKLVKINGDEYRFIPIKPPTIKFEWENWVIQHRFKIGLLIGLIIGGILL